MTKEFMKLNAEYRHYEKNKKKYPTVFEDGDWYMIKDSIGGTHEIITAKHACPPGSQTLPSSWDWMASDNVVRGYCSQCGADCPDSIKTLWYLYNADAIPFYWQKWRDK